MNVSTIITLITFTVFFTGGTTKWMLDFLHYSFPKDKIYRDPDDVEDSDAEDDGKSVDFEYADYIDGYDTKSQGAISRFEQFDQNVLQAFLRKERPIDDYDPLGKRFTEDDFKFPILIEDDKSLPPARPPPKHRDSIMHVKGIPKKVNKVQFSLPIEEDKKHSDPTFLSPGRDSRRSTITHHKLDADVLRKYSIIAAGK